MNKEFNYVVKWSEEKGWEVDVDSILTKGLILDTDSSEWYNPYTEDDIDQDEYLLCLLLSKIGELNA